MEEMNKGGQPPVVAEDGDDSSLSDDDDDDEDQFQTLCDGFETGINFCSESFNHVVKLKNEVMKHQLPVNTLRQLTLSLAKLQRSFIDMSQQGTELIRLVRVYSTPWKDKTRSLKALHKDYNNKQKKLDIAMQKFEMLASRNKMLEGEKVVMNWEKLYMALHSTRCDGLGWKYVVQLLKKKKAEGGNMQDLLRVLEDQEKAAAGSKPRTRQRPRGAGRGFNMSAALEAKDAAFEAASEGGDSLNVSVSLRSGDDADISMGSDTSVSLGLPLSDGGKAESSVFEWMSRISGRQDEEGTVGLQEEASNSRTGVSMGSWHTRIQEEGADPPYDPVEPSYPPDGPDVYPHEEQAQNSAKGSTSVHEAPVPPAPPVATAVYTTETATWTGDVEYDHYLIMRLSAPVCQYLTHPWCTIAIDGQVMKTEVFSTGHRDNEDEEEEEEEARDAVEKPAPFEEVLFRLDVDNDDIRSSSMFTSAGVVRIAVHPDLNKSMVAMATTQLSSINGNEEQTVDLLEDVDKLPLEETELPLMATIDKEEIRFNQQCGSIRILCALIRCVRSERVDVSTETIALEDLINDMLEEAKEQKRLERCRSACEQTELDIYTQHDMDEYKIELKKELEQLNTQYEQRLSGIIGDATDTVRQYIDITTTPLLAEQQGSKPASPTPSTALLQDGVEWHPPPLPADMYAAYERQNQVCKQPAWRPVGNAAPTFPTPPTPAPPSERGKEWGKDLPEDFFQRLSLFTESSERYQQALRKKLKMETERDLGTKLQALKKYKAQENGKEGSIYAERVILPSLFAPMKRHMGTGGVPVTRGRSFINGLIVTADGNLPLLKPSVSKRDIDRFLAGKQ